MNVAIINLKGISKNIIKVIIGLVLLIFITKILFINIGVLQKIFSFKICASMYTSFFNTVDEVEYETNHVEVLQTLSPLLVAINKEVSSTTEPVINEPTEEKNNIVISKTANTEAVSERNLSENFNITYSNVKIRNQSNYELSEDIFSEEGMTLTNTKKILIYHTHTCESYTPSEKYNYTMTGNYRTTDNNYNVVRLGEELSRLIKTKRI